MSASMTAGPAPCAWQVHANGASWSSPQLELRLDPCRGLLGVLTKPDNIRLERLLGVEIIDAIGLGPRPLDDGPSPPELVCRQDVIMAAYTPTAQRPVECHARWRVHSETVLDLEISTLTPGQWGGLSVRTCSELSPGTTARLAPLLYLHRPHVPTVSYVEMCHPHDGIGLDLEPLGVARFHLFGHDLEKGVILRGRLRGLFVSRDGDEHSARAAYEQFIREPPNLS